MKYYSNYVTFFNYAARGFKQPRRKVRISAEQGTQAVTGQLMSLPCEELRSEATVNSMRCVIYQNIAKSREKALQLPEDHIAFERVCRSRLHGDFHVQDYIF